MSLIPQRLDEPLQGRALALAGILLGLGNFVVVLDLSVANVSVPVIAGSLSVSPNQGTWMITSYAIADAITVPLSGWLTARYGPVRTFVTALSMFGLFSFLCGFASSLQMLVAMRVLQGLSGGPLIPVSQALLLRVFGKDRHGAATAVWGMTTLIGPAVGPLLGGTLCDTLGWEWIFYVNVPIAAGCAFILWRMLGKRDDAPDRHRIDFVGLALLVVGVASLQIVLDKGNQLDWFGSPFIVTLTLISAIACVAFVLWELTERFPVVDLSVLANRNYTCALLSASGFYAAVMGGGMLLTLWLEGGMGYTAVESGKVQGMNGLAAFFVAPVTAKLGEKFDLRTIGIIGMCLVGSTYAIRSFYSPEVDYWMVLWPTIMLGLALPIAFFPILNLAISTMPAEKYSAATGLMSFTRTVSGAFGIAIITTLWDTHATVARSGLVDALPASSGAASGAASGLTTLGISPDLALLDGSVGAQALLIATNQIHAILAGVAVCAAGCLLMVRRPRNTAGQSGDAPAPLAH
jgi:DHA2 family multidrug resistance protein